MMDGESRFEKRTEEIPGHVTSNETRIPGYQGYIRGQQHFYGKTYGDMTRASTGHEFGPSHLGDPVDEVPDVPGPHVERGSNQGPEYRVPGYAGYVPGSKFDFAKTFGNTTDQLIGGHTAELQSSPSKPRMLTTTTTDMLNGKSTVHLPNPQAGYREASVQIKAPDMVDGNIPGYAGFIRGSQHFYGSTYGATTTVAPDHDFTASKMSKGLPPPPHKLDASKGPQHADLDELPCDRPPGYGGHVPLAKFEYANTFGSTCVDMVSAHKDGEAMFRSGQTVSSSTIAS